MTVQINQAGKPKTGIFYGYFVILCAFIIMTVGVGGHNSFGVFFEPMLNEFGWTRAATSAAFSLSLVFSGLVGMAAGRLNDKFGPRILLSLGCLLMTLGYLLMSRISAIWQFYLFYGILMGTGFGTIFVPLLSTAARWFTQRRGIMTGVILAGVGTGTMTMPPLSSWLISIYGWRNSFIILAIFSLAVIISSAQFLKRDPQGMGLLPDNANAMKRKNQHLAATGLSVWEAVRTARLWMLFVIVFCVGLSVYTIMTHVVIHATGQGISPAKAAVTLSILGACNIAGRLVMGNAVDRIGGSRAQIIGISIMVISLIWLLTAKNIWMLYLFSGIFGFAYAASFVPTSPMVAEFFGLKAHGALFGLVDFGFVLGGTIGPVLAGYIFDVTRSYQNAFIILLVICIIGLILALILKRVRSTADSPAIMKES